MFDQTKAVYQATRKRHDQLFNTYVMRPIAAFTVVVLSRTPVTPNQLTIVSLFVFMVAAGLLIGLQSLWGGVVAVLVIELSYMFDCADGMLARHRNIASKQGHLFDFFTDEIKAVVLAGALAIRGWLQGGWGIDGQVWPVNTPGFLFAGIGSVIVIASATSLTNFLRHPEISGKTTPVNAHYESVESAPTVSLVHRLGGWVATFLRFLNHYPSHLWFFAALGRLDLFFWTYAGINLLYLGRGWLGVLIRFGRPSDSASDAVSGS